MIRTVSLNPAIDVTMEFEHFKLGATNRPQAIREDAGGKGIVVSKMLNSMGKASQALAVLAGDNGRRLEAMLNDAGLSYEGIYLKKGNTRRNIKIVDRSNAAQTEINEPGPTADADEVACITDRLRAQCRPGDIVIFSGSLCPGMKPDHFRQMLSVVKHLGCKLIVDTSGQALQTAFYFEPDFLKPNLAELEDILGWQPKTQPELEQAAKMLLEMGAKKAIISMGEKGSCFVSREHFYRSKPIPVKVESCVGAGDSMVAAMAYSIDAKLPDPEAYRLAIAASLATITQKGTQTGSMELCKQILKEVEIHS